MLAAALPSQRVHLGAFTFDREDLTNALISAHARGCRVTVAVDKRSTEGGSTANQHQQIRRLSASGIAVSLCSGVPIHEEYGGQTVWDGSVSVFDLKGSDSGAFRAYAWSYDLPDGKRRFFAVLHTPKIIGPREAVRAAIVAEARAGK